MAKKSKKAKSAAEPTVEAAAGDLEVEVAPEPAEDKPEKKRKKVKAEKADTNGDANHEENGAPEPSEKPGKKRRRQRKLGNLIQTVTLLRTATRMIRITS